MPAVVNMGASFFLGATIALALRNTRDEELLSWPFMLLLAASGLAGSLRVVPTVAGIYTETGTSIPVCGAVGSNGKKLQQTPWQSLPHYTPESLPLTDRFPSGSTYRTPSWDDSNLIASAKAGCYSFHNLARISTIADAMDAPPFSF